MSGFYGDFPSLPLMPFYFDKIYEDISEADLQVYAIGGRISTGENVEADNVYLNRYVLLKNKEQKDAEGNIIKESTARVYQKKINEINNKYYKFIASLTAPFTTKSVNMLRYPSYSGFSGDDYKIKNVGAGGSVVVGDNINWTTDDEMKYDLNLHLYSINYALNDIYNALAGMNTPMGEKRKDNIIPFYYNVPIDTNISISDMIYHIAYEQTDFKYYLIMPSKFEEKEVSGEELFNSLKEQNIMIFKDGEPYFKNQYISGLKYKEPDLSDNYSYNLISLKDMTDSVYGLISQFNLLLEGEYEYDKRSLEGCIKIAQKLIDQIDSINDIQTTFSSKIIDTNSYSGVEITSTNSITLLNGLVKTGQDKIQIIAPANDHVVFGYNQNNKNISINLPKYHTTKGNYLEIKEREDAYGNFAFYDIVPLPQTKIIAESKKDINITVNDNTTTVKTTSILLYDINTEIYTLEGIIPVKAINGSYSIEPSCLKNLNMNNIEILNIQTSGEIASIPDGFISSDDFFTNTTFINDSFKSFRVKLCFPKGIQVPGYVAINYSIKFKGVVTQ